MMRIINYLLIIAFFLAVGSAKAQPWMSNIDKSNDELTLFDYQKAFNEYWEPFNVKGGWYTDTKGLKHKAGGWKQFKRWEHFWSSRVNPITGEFSKTSPSEQYKKHIQTYGNYSKNGGTWQTMGTNSSTGGYAGIGRINTVAFHPTDNNVFWIGAPAGGLWVTTDAGSNWTVLTDNNDVLGVSAIVIPSDFETSNTIYIGTGDRDASDNNSVGVLKSIDGGVTWNPTGLSFIPSQSENINSMFVDPSDDNSIFAAASDGLYFTDDAGLNWTKLTTLEFVDLEYKPGNVQTIYGSTRGGRIYASYDYGQNWAQVFASINSNRAEMAVTPANPELIYVLASNTAQGMEGVYKSDDSGATFSLVFDTHSLLDWSTDGSGDDGQAWYDLSMAADPNNADVLFCGGVNTWMSTNGGVSWELANHWYGGGGAQAVHADKHYMKFRNNTSELFECNDGGIYSTFDGNSWVDLTNGLVISQIYGLSTAQNAPDITITGLQDNGTKMRAEASWYDVMGGDGMKCLIDFSNYNTQYGSLYYGQIHRTNTLWSSSTEISANIPGGATGNWVTPYVLDPNDNNTIYVGYGNLWKSTDKGNNFTSIGSFGGNLKVVTVAPSNSNIICVSGGSSIMKTVNGGTSWTTISSGLPTSSSINSISFKNNDPNVIWATFGTYNEHGVYKTTDGGQNWTNISSGLPQIPVNTIIQNKLVSDYEQLYVGTDFGVYLKEGDADWTLFSVGLPNVVVTELDIYYNYASPFDSRLRASTYGRGLWQSELTMSPNFSPYLSTLDVSNITVSSADISGSVNNNFGFDVLESGIIVSLNPNPSLTDTEALIFQTNPVVSTGEYTISASGLQSSSKYYYRAYAVNENGTGYGGVMQFFTSCTTINSFPYTQDFENSGVIPNCWTEEYVEGDANSWIFVKGSGEGSIPNSHSGVYNALFKDSDLDNDKVRLVMPAMDLSSLSQARLTFWHAQKDLFTFTDELRVFYKNSSSGTWIELSSYSDVVDTWTFRSLNLPNLSSEYYIAFEGNALSGKGVLIDDVTVEFSNKTEFVGNTGVSVFPNPSTGIIQINSSNEIISDIQISNVTGQVIYQNSNIKNQVIDISSNASGIYFMKITLNGKSYIHKIVVE